MNIYELNELIEAVKALDKSPERDELLAYYYRERRDLIRVIEAGIADMLARNREAMLN